MREWPQFKMRMPPEIKKYLAKEAKQNRRTLNSEIVYRLQMTISRPQNDEGPGAGTPEPSDITLTPSKDTSYAYEDRSN
jgi:hypothetical protein